MGEDCVQLVQNEAQRISDKLKDAANARDKPRAHNEEDEEWRQNKGQSHWSSGVGRISSVVPSPVMEERFEESLKDFANQQWELLRGRQKAEEEVKCEVQDWDSRISAKWQTVTRSAKEETDATDEAWQRHLSKLV